MEATEAQREHFFSARESGSSTSSSTLSEGEDGAADVAVVKVVNFEPEEGKPDAEEEDDEGSDDDEDEKVNGIRAEWRGIISPAPRELTRVRSLLQWGFSTLKNCHFLRDAPTKLPLEVLK